MVEHTRSRRWVLSSVIEGSFKIILALAELGTRGKVSAKIPKGGLEKNEIMMKVVLRHSKEACHNIGRKFYAKGSNRAINMGELGDNTIVEFLQVWRSSQ